MISISLKDKAKNISQAIKDALERLAQAEVNIKALIDEIDGVELPKDDDKPKLLTGVTIYLNAGHGSVHPRTGKYMTFAGDGKFYEFITDDGKTAEVAYEGQLNRLYTKLIASLLIQKGATVIEIHHPYEDRYNAERAKIANEHYNSLTTEQKYKCLWFSVHFNAHGMQSKGKSLSPRGASIWTMPGSNAADIAAEKIWTKFKEYTKDYGISYREDKKDGDADYEEYFHEFTLTQMPAVLMETLFFTNWQDFKIAQRIEFQYSVANAVVDGLVDYFGD